MNLLSTFVFCVCVRVYVCGFYNYLFFFLICLLFRAFFFCFFSTTSALSSLFICLFLRLLPLPSFGSSIFLCVFFFILFAFLSRNNTLSLSFFSLSILANRFVRDRTPPVLPRNSPFLFSLSVALFRLPPVLPSHENYPETRESKRDREVRRGGI